MSTFEYVVWERTHDDTHQGAVAICRTRATVFDAVEDHVKWVLKPDIDEARVVDDAKFGELVEQRNRVVLDFETELKRQQWTPSLCVVLGHHYLDREILVQAALVYGT
jgi:hypothetical protein